jgi:hypothetical protein
MHAVRTPGRWRPAKPSAIEDRLYVGANWAPGCAAVWFRLCVRRSGNHLATTSPCIENAARTLRLADKKAAEATRVRRLERSRTQVRG